MKPIVEKWLNNTIGAFIQGGSHALGATIATATANGFGLDVPTLSWKQCGTIFIVSGALKMFNVLEKMPLPGFREDTQFFAKQSTPSHQESDKTGQPPV